MCIADFVSIGRQMVDLKSKHIANACVCAQEIKHDEQERRLGRASEELKPKRVGRKK